MQRILADFPWCALVKTLRRLIIKKLLWLVLQHNQPEILRPGISMLQVIFVNQPVAVRNIQGIVKSELVRRARQGRNGQLTGDHLMVRVADLVEVCAVDEHPEKGIAVYLPGELI